MTEGTSDGERGSDNDGCVQLDAPSRRAAVAAASSALKPVVVALARQTAARSIDFDDYSDLLSPQQHLRHVSLQGLRLSLDLLHHRLRDVVVPRLHLDRVGTLKSEMRGELLHAPRYFSRAPNGRRELYRNYERVN